LKTPTTRGFYGPISIKRVQRLSEETRGILDGMERITFYLDDLYPKGSWGRDNEWWWLAKDGPAIIAFSGMVRSSAEPTTAYLCRCGVLKPWRGRGLQGRMLKARERHARKLGFKWLVADTAHPTSIASSNNLIKNGFRLYDPPFYWGTEGALYWRKRLRQGPSNEQE